MATMDVVTPADVVAQPDAVTLADVVTQPDAVTPADVPTDAGSPVPLTLTGDFVGGAASGTAGGVVLIGHFHWNASVSGSNGGISLEGVLR